MLRDFLIKGGSDSLLQLSELTKHAELWTQIAAKCEIAGPANDKIQAFSQPKETMTRPKDKETLLHLREILRRTKKLLRIDQKYRSLPSERWRRNSSNMSLNNSPLCWAKASHVDHKEI